MGERVESAADDQSHHDHRRLRAEPEGRPGQAHPVGEELRDDGDRGVYVDRHAELLGFRQKRPIAFFVQVGIPEVGVGVPANESKLSYAALKLFDGRIGIFGGERSVSHEPFRVFGDSLRHKIVRSLREPRAQGRPERLRAWRREREHRDVDAGFIHGFDAALTEVAEFCLVERDPHAGHVVHANSPVRCLLQARVGFRVGEHRVYPGRG